MPDAESPIDLARGAILAGLALLTLAPVAVSLDGDAAFAPTSPADGATLPVDPTGVPVTFSCPVYRSLDLGGGFVTFGGAKDYSVLLSTEPTLGVDGRLATISALVSGVAAPGTPEQCSVRLGSGGAARPQETPGVYYWQISRLCAGCARGYETGPVRRLTLSSSGSAVLVVPARIFAGYPFIATVSPSGVPTSATIELQRLTNGTWVSLARDGLVRRPAELTVTLMGGPQTLRALVTIGAQTIASPTVARRVATAATIVPLQTGTYRGVVGTGTRSAAFRVTGRTLTDFRAFVPMLCPGIAAGQFTTQIGTAALKSIPIAPDGTFVGVAVRAGSSIRVRGRLAVGKVRGGRIELSVGSCAGNIGFQARRRTA